ncbi:MAG: hypothetical protein P4N59_28890 [Negativicutes bacterium]|nr:hypothetical protein [Negativicutes bacterium]
MESALQHAARTLGLPESVLPNFMCTVSSIRSWDTSCAAGSTSGIFRSAETADKPRVDTSILFNALIDEYDKKL